MIFDFFYFDLHEQMHCPHSSDGRWVSTNEYLKDTPWGDVENEKEGFWPQDRFVLSCHNASLGDHQKPLALCRIAPLFSTEWSSSF